jgi:hypothetical protein
MVRLYIILYLRLVATTRAWPCFDKSNWLMWLCLGRHNISSHASKTSKVTMSRLLGRVISELVLILLNLDFEIDRSWMSLGRFLNDIHITTWAKYYPHSNSYLCWALLRDVSNWVLKFFRKWFATQKKDFASLTKKYWRAYLHSRICVHRQYIHKSPISIIMV